jgi:hypothetical protein
MPALVPLLRRDTKKHMPPRPGLHPHPVTPPPRPHPSREGTERDFWEELERRHERHEEPARGEERLAA